MNKSPSTRERPKISPAGTPSSVPMSNDAKSRKKLICTLGAISGANCKNTLTAAGGVGRAGVFSRSAVICQPASTNAIENTTQNTRQAFVLRNFSRKVRARLQLHWLLLAAGYSSGAHRAFEFLLRIKLIHSFVQKFHMTRGVLFRAKCAAFRVVSQVLRKISFFTHPVQHIIYLLGLGQLRLRVFA